MTDIRIITNDFMHYIPNILKAVILLLIAWGVATLAKKLTEKLLANSKVDNFLGRSQDPHDPNYGKVKVKSISQLVYFLVFILFIPSILDALEMDAVSGPISNMMNNLLGFIPNILGAGVILFIGYFVAKIIRGLVYNLLQAVNVDRLYNKMMPDLVQNNTNDPNSIDKVQKQTTLSKLLSQVVFIIILIPVITMALETLNFRTLTEPIVMVLNNVLNMIPNIFVALIILIIGYYIAKIVGDLLEGILSKVGFQRIYSFLGQNDMNELRRFNLEKIIANVVKGLILLFMTVEALRVLRLDVLNTIGYSIIGYVPFLISGLIIIGLGIFAGYYVESLIVKYAKSPFSAAIAKYSIIVFAVFMTLEQIKFASTIVNMAFLLILGGLSVAFAISFGIGGRDFAKRQLEKFEKKMDNQESITNIITDKNINDNNINNNNNKM